MSVYFKELYTGRGEMSLVQSGEGEGALSRIVYKSNLFILCLKKNVKCL